MDGVMENWIIGGDLKQLLARQPKKRLAEAWAQFYAAELVEAVAYLHQV